MLRVYKQNCYLFINRTLLSSCVCVKNVFSTPNIMEQILKKAEKARESLIPSKSEAVYQKEYKIYLEWLTRNNVMPKDATETVLLAYFQELSETYSPNSLWTKWSMLKSKVNIHEKRDIAKFNELEAFLKRKSKSYKPKKSAVLSPNDVIRFLKNAPNEIHLLHKVVLIMGYFGGCRSQELLNMKISDIEDRDSVMVVNVPESKTGVSKKFTIVDEKEFSALPLLRLYMSLRPKGIERFFLRFRQNKCTSQLIGKNMFGKIPSKIAMYLGLPNPSSYTGHCLRRTSATALANAEATKYD
ncbi:uncharacterized protein LOC111691604 [Anoplophora glabripennis]|uniref:uncharacterized protein LOC111691604 n=2 Tax=Anoplophora glabripennis TaxID=217634 RepID=UPI000C781B32|nr:uncharacterized protein LOC111691604 [Anoplophora glabripennis]